MVAADTVPAPAPSSAGYRGHLEVRLGAGPVVRRPLDESPIVVGRVPGVQLQLDHHTVSRRHAELSCDPFGRWWIRDLGSTNGTIVNDELVTERVLQPGDWIRIGDFMMSFQSESSIPQPKSSSPGREIAIEDKPTALKTLHEFDAPRLQAKHLFTLMDLSRRFLTIENPEERYAVLCQLVVREDFHGSLALALRLEGNSLTILSGPHRPAGARLDEPPYISRRVLNHLVETGEPVLAGNLHGARGPMELTLSREVMALWVVACPLRRDQGVLELLYVTLPPECGNVEWLGLVSLAAEVYQQSEAAWAARMHAQAHASIERELEMARQIQRAVVPASVESLGLDVSIVFEPCKWVGGDYVDVVPMPDGRLLLTTADVCGKGLQAALIASSLHTLVRATIDAGRSLTELMERMNTHLCRYLPEHSFVTMVVVAIDPRTGELECVNAGHPPVLIASGQGTLRYLQAAQNPPLGVVLATMDVQHAVLEPGDALFMYTDGLTELRNAQKEMLGINRLADGFSQLCVEADSQPSREIAGKISELAEQFRGTQPPEDDRAYIVAKRRSSATSIPPR